MVALTFPPIDLFETLTADPQDRAELMEVEMLTNPRVGDASQPPTKVQKRMYLSDLDAPLMDSRHESNTSPCL
jgi:hypothetical protein